MPISSTDVQNILSAQVGMFSSAAQYAQAVSAQYGYQPGGGTSVQDPRNVLAQQSGMLASGAVQGADFGLGVMGTAAMMGAAPRMFDPFTSMAGAATYGYRAGGMAGMVAPALAVGGTALAVSSIYRWSADQVIAGAQERAVLNSQLGGLAPSLGASQLNQMSAMVSGTARQSGAALQEITSLVQAGTQDGTINMQSLTQFQQSFQRLLGNVRQVASALSTSLTEAQQALQTVRSMGVSSDQAGQFLGSMRMIGQGAGLSPQQMMGVASQGLQLGRQLGLNPTATAVGMMMNQGVANMVGRDSLIEGVDANSHDRFSNAAFRFLGSGRGRTVLAAMIGENGTLDQDVAAQVANGTLSGAELRRMGARNLGRRGMRDMLMARSGELAGEFITQFGPQAISPAVQAMTEGLPYAETMRASLTGLNRAEIDQMSELNRMMPSLKGRLMEEGRAGFNDGMRRANFAETMEATIAKVVAPFRDRLRQYGAELTSSVHETIEGVTRDFMGSPPPKADPSTYQRYISAYMRGGGTNNSVYRQLQPYLSGMGGEGMFGPSIPTPSSSFMRRLPSGLRLGSMADGVGMEDLPLYGLGTESYDPYSTMGAAALRFGGGRLGAGLGAIGLGLTEATAGASVGMMGLGGVGTAVGAARFAGYAARAGGYALRMGAGPVGTAMLAADVATNVLPGVGRGLGVLPITEGAVLGEQAELMRFISQNGLAGDERLKMMRTWAGGDDTSGYSPIGRSDSDPFGQQPFMSKRFLERVREMAKEAPKRISEFEQRHGARGRNIIERAVLMSDDPEGRSQIIAKQAGISLEEARRLTAAAGMTGLADVQTGRYDEAKERKTLLEQMSDNITSGRPIPAEYLEAYTATRDLMNPEFTKSHLTVDRQMMALSDQNIPHGTEEWGDEMLRYLDKAAPKLSADSRAYLTELLAENRISPLGVSDTPSADNPLGTLMAKQAASNWYAYNKTRSKGLSQEQPGATEVFRNASIRSGMAAASNTLFVDDYTNAPDEKGRIEAMQKYAGVMANMKVGSKGWSSFSRSLSHSGSEAARRASVMADTFAQFTSLRERKAKNVRYATDLLGADLRDLDRGLVEREFRDVGRKDKFDPRVEAALVEQFQQLQTPGLYGEKASWDAATAMTHQLHEALADQKTDPSKLSKLVGEIATMRAQAGAAKRPGEAGQAMDEVIGRLGEFKRALEGATNAAIDRGGSGGSSGT